MLSRVASDAPTLSPFTYGLVVQQVYDQGTVFSPKVLDITDDDLLVTFQSGLADVADVTFKEAATLKEFLADPSKFAAVAAAAAPAAAEAAPAAAKEEEPEEESDDDMGFGLFD